MTSMHPWPLPCERNLRQRRLRWLDGHDVYRADHRHASHQLHRHSHIDNKPIFTHSDLLPFATRRTLAQRTGPFYSTELALPAPHARTVRQNAHPVHVRKVTP